MQNFTKLKEFSKYKLKCRENWKQARGYNLKGSKKHYSFRFMKSRA